MAEELSEALILLGKKIKAGRDKRGWSQARLAEEANLSERSIGRIENGEQIPKVTSLYRIRKVLDWGQDPLIEDLIQIVKQKKQRDVD